jgi:hypothetical protein
MSRGAEEMMHSAKGRGHSTKKGSYGDKGMGTRMPVLSQDRRSGERRTRDDRTKDEKQNEVMRRLKKL